MNKYETMDVDGGENSPWMMKIFTSLVVVSQIFGIGSVVLTGIWLGHFREGFAWQSNPSLQFNYHPLFMVLGMIFLYGDAILVYRVFRNDKKICVKVIHASLQLLSLIFAAVGLKAVFDSHNLATKPVPNMYSLHSWLGMATVVLFGIQWLFGFASFLLPGLTANMRAMYKPVHVFWGVVIYVMAVSTALMGFTEKLIFTLGSEYSKKGEEAILVNVIGSVLVVLAAITVYLVTNRSFQRQPLPEEEQLRLQE